MIVNEMNVEVVNIITELSQKSEIKESDLKSYIDRLKAVWIEGSRHEYSEITRILFSVSADKDSREYICGYLKDMCEIAKDNKENSLKFVESLERISDHVNLENIRMVELTKISAEANKAFTEVNDVKARYSELEEKWQNINSEAEKVDQKLKKMDKDIDNSTSKSITILGIFSGIVMAFTGGLSFIASSLENMNEVSIYRLVLVIILLSMGIFNVIFMLMHTIGKFTSSYVGGECNCENTFKGCCDKKLKCAVVRYPLASYFNILCAVAIMTLVFLYTMDRFNLITKLLSYNTYGIACLIFMFIVYLLAIGFIIWKISKIECEYEYVESPIANLRYMTQAFRGRYTKKEKYKK